MLELKHLSYAVQEGGSSLGILNDISLTVGDGKLVVFTGPNGGGKTTLAKSIMGLVTPTAGQILWNGKDITGYSIRRRSLEGISYIPEDRQAFGLVLDFTLGENLALKDYFKEPFSHKGILDQGEITRYGEELIGRYDIRSGQGVGTVVRSMSGGNQQKAIIGREI